MRNLELTIAILVVVAIAIAPIPRAVASQGAASPSNSGNASQDSSQNSNSGASSQGSSQNSNSGASSQDSSKGSNSGNSCQDTANSIKASQTNSNGSSNNASQSSFAYSAVAFLISVVVGAVAVGAAFGIRSSSRRSHKKGVADVQTFMRKNHALLVHDVALASGPLLDAWAHRLGLSRPELARLETRLEGSADQTQLLDALNGDITPNKARAFAADYYRLVVHALGPKRAAQVVEAASAQL